MLIPAVLLMILNAKRPLKGTVVGFSLMEVLCALGALGLVVALLFQGLGHMERGRRASEQKKTLLALKEALKRELIYHPPPLLATKLLQEGPLVYLDCSQTRLEIEDGMRLSPNYSGRETFVVYARPLESTMGAMCAQLDLCPLYLNGVVGESLYSFPFCL